MSPVAPALPSKTFRQAFRTAKRWLKSRVGRDVFVRPRCFVPLVTLGDGAGAWTLSPESLGRDSVVYSLGVGRDISFERALIEQYNVTVHAFDPTPLALGWAESQQLPQRFVLHPVGVADYDGTACFQPPIKAKFESFSLVRTSGVGTAIEAPVQRLGTLTRMLGHSKVDLLKMDIEGAEYQVIRDLLESRIEIRQVLVEFHHRWKEVGALQTRQAIKALGEGGFDLVAVSPAGTEYTFILQARERPAQNSSSTAG